MPPAAGGSPEEAPCEAWAGEFSPTLSGAPIREGKFSHQPPWRGHSWERVGTAGGRTHGRWARRMLPRFL